MSRSVWAATLAIDVDGIRIGIRAQDEKHQGWLRALLGDRIVHDPEVLPNYSVRVSDSPKALHLLYWGGCLVARCRTREELVAAIDAHLGGHRPPPQGGLRFSGLAVTSGNRGVVFTHVDQTFGARLGPRLRSSGATLAVRPWIDVDVHSNRLVPAGTIGLTAPKSVMPKIVALLVPEVITQLGVGDRVLALQRGGSIRLDGADLGDAVALLRSVRTESVGALGISRAAESVRRVLTKSDQKSGADTASEA